MESFHAWYSMGRCGEIGTAKDSPELRQSYTVRDGRRNRRGSFYEKTEHAGKNHSGHIAFMLVTNLGLGAVLMRQSQKAMKTLIDERMLDIVNTAAAMLDGDVLNRLRAEDKGTPDYEQAMKTLCTFRDNINLAYIYYVRAEGEREFTFGIDSDPVAPGEFGSPVENTDALYRASKGQALADDVPYEDRWGRFYSAYSPVFSSSGDVAAVVTVDFDVDWYEKQLNQNTWTIVFACGLFLSVGILLVVILTRQYGK
ncbi:MAG: cache domain-containing protein [Solobacterium sp.]|nr:cache domain-containing protein [Solobacterium sp.]